MTENLATRIALVFLQYIMLCIEMGALVKGLVTLITSLKFLATRNSLSTVRPLSIGLATFYASIRLHFRVYFFMMSKVEQLHKSLATLPTLGRFFFTMNYLMVS